MNAIATEVSVSVIAGFAADGRVYRAFDHLLAVGAADLLLVPLGRTTGDLRHVTDGCPLPWPEVWTVIDADPKDIAATLNAPGTAVPVPPEAMCADHPRLALITPYGWTLDLLAHRMERLTHVSGIRFARVA